MCMGIKLLKFNFQSLNFVQLRWAKIAVKKNYILVQKFCIERCEFFNLKILNLVSIRGGLVVELWSDNRLHSATVGSNLHQVWCINRSVEETLCHNSNCRTPGLRVYYTHLDVT